MEGLAVPEGRPLLYEVNGLASIEMPYHYPKMVEHLTFVQTAL